MSFAGPNQLNIYSFVFPELSYPKLQGRPSSSLDACSKAALPVAIHEGRWPWMFEKPGRCSNLPAEEVFEGFGGLEGLFDGDDFNHQTDDQNDQSKVSREIRKACHSPVAIDPAPAPKLVALSQTGAALTGIPRGSLYGEKDGSIGLQKPISPKNDGERALIDQELKELALALTGNRLLEGSRPFASCYGGHQFGNWAGQLGDGRVATLGEVRAVAGQHEVAGIAGTWNGSSVEVQLKGIGKTPFSRGGDGKAVLGACLREFLFSEAFIGLGLDAAVVVSVCCTGEDAMIRDPDPKNSGALKKATGAILCRAAPSFLRFGSFELPARRGEVEVVRQLADFCLRFLRPCLDPRLDVPGRISSPAADPSRNQKECTSLMRGQETSQHGEERGRRKHDQFDKDTAGSRTDYLELLVAIVQATARMVAGWSALGFCHGVLNTDNFTLLGLGLDFGPCSFMESYDPSWTPNEGDSALRYTFQNQPDVAAWNCERLTEAFSSLVGVSGVAEANEAFSPAFDAAYTAHLERKLGLAGMELGNGWVDLLRNGAAGIGETKGQLSPDANFVLEFFVLMSTCRTDFTRTWRALLDVPAFSVALRNKCSSGSRFQSKAERLTLNKTPSSKGCDPLSKDLGRGGQNPPITSDADNSQDGYRVEITDEEALRPFLAILKEAEVSNKQIQAWAAWIREYMVRIDTQGVGRPHSGDCDEGRRNRLEMMRTSSPAFVLRTRALEQAVKAAEQGDLTLVHQLTERLSRPYGAEHGDSVQY